MKIRNHQKPQQAAGGVVLGVDGGATSTTCVCIPFLPLSDPDDLPILGRAIARCSNHNSVGDIFYPSHQQRSFKEPMEPLLPGQKEIDFVKSLQPKLSEFHRVYSSPEFNCKVLEKWSPKARIDLSAIKKLSEEIFWEEERRWRGKGNNSLRFKEFRWDWKGEGDGEESFGDWKPIRALKTRFRDLEVKKSSEEIFGGLKNNKFLEKLKSSLVLFAAMLESFTKISILDDCLENFSSHVSPLSALYTFGRISVETLLSRHMPNL